MSVLPMGVRLPLKFVEVKADEDQNEEKPKDS